VKQIVTTHSGSDRWAPRPAKANLTIPDSDASAWTEIDAPAEPVLRERSLRLLTHWLIAAARKGAPVADSIPVEGSQNRLDVGPGAKVGSDGR
jgi:hypothetical protein